MEPLFLKGVLQEKIWGGTKLRDEFGYDLPSETTGEHWSISAHPNGPATVKNGEHAGKTLTELWASHRDLFGHQEGEVFPLLTKIIDAKNDLSVQVHPDDEYGLANEGELGKTECWYVLAADEGAEIVFGHNAETKEEFHEMIADGQWDKLLRSIQVKPGDFFYVPSGTVHAIGSGVTILETQQSSDTTYRLYDYDRKDDAGNFRDLHINQSIAVSMIPHVDPQPEMTVTKVDNSELKKLVSNDFFTVYEWIIKNSIAMEREGLYTLVSIVDGKGSIEVDGTSYPLEKGDHFLLPNEVDNWTFTGDLHIIASHP
ncbi:MAG: mannose-6-phosphate isomerase, class I [Clostridiaceae bacterium]|nr:mannose-6-phosphate isomerase, class I [Clostridiaceae bacterium]